MGTAIQLLILSIVLVGLSFSIGTVSTNLEKVGKIKEGRVLGAISGGFHILAWVAGFISALVIVWHIITSL